MAKTDAQLADLAVQAALVEHGLANQLDGALPALSGLKVTSKRTKMPNWSDEEEKFLRDNLGVISDAEIGRILGRSEVAVTLHWKRDMQLPPPSRTPGHLTARDAARLLGVDEHKVAHWVVAGLITGRLMAGERKIRLIKMDDLERWACDPQNMMYFDPRRVKDAALRRKVLKAMKDWGNEWWTTRRMADHHDVCVGDVKRQIVLGRLRSFHLPVSLGGRHAKRKWSLHFVLKSDAVAYRFTRRK